MSEEGLLARRLRDARDRGVPIALATVVSAEGSAYRRPGAWMTISADGAREGLLSGGCLEEDVAERALACLTRGVPDLATYDTRQQDDLVWGLRMGCQGVVRILIEPLSGERLARTAELFSRVEDVREESILATVCAIGPDGPGSEGSSAGVLIEAEAKAEAAIGDRLLVAGSGILASTFRDCPPGLEARARERVAAGARASALETVGGVGVAFRSVVPRIRLVVCGAGEDAIPLALLAAGLDWSVLVADHRPGLARPERFPGARVELVSRAADLPPLIAPPHSRVAAVVMTHNTERDVEWMAALLPLDLGYLGILGPKRRGDQVLRVATPLAGSPSRARRIVSPVGLDIASETPREIAIAIVAEISALLAERAGGSLSGREAPIHPAASETSSAPLDSGPPKRPS